MKMMSEAPAGFIGDALVEVDRIVKRQRTCAAKTSGTLYKLIHALERCVEELRQTPTDDNLAARAAGLVREIDDLDAVATISADTKELHGAVSKLGKIVDKEFATDIGAGIRDVHMDEETLDRAVAEHLYHEGMFAIGDTFAEEAHIDDVDNLKSPYSSMHAVLEDLRARRLDSAMRWVAANKVTLRGTSLLESREPSDIEFSLHRLAYFQILQEQGPRPALDYARQHFPQFQNTERMADIQKLLGALCFFNRKNSGINPYAEYFGNNLWEDFARDFQKQSCALLGQAIDSPLLVAVSAGAAALPTLMKLASVVAKAQPTTDLGTQDQLPVEIPLGNEFVFHSIFACPVSREQSTADNPPIMLPCGHCLCKQSVIRMAKSITRVFKCPYCPVEATLQQCTELHFADVA